MAKNSFIVSRPFIFWDFRPAIHIQSPFIKGLIATKIVSSPAISLVVDRFIFRIFACKTIQPKKVTEKADIAAAPTCAKQELGIGIKPFSYFC